VSSERDTLQIQVNNQANKINQLQISLAEEQIARGREADKNGVLAKQISTLGQECATLKSDLLEKSRAGGPGPVDVKSSPEYKMLLKDLKLLLSHREEINDMRQLITKLQ